jgi:hypothetical protein
MDKLSDKELASYLVNSARGKSIADVNDKNKFKKELLHRLDKGRRAMLAVKKMKGVIVCKYPADCELSEAIQEYEKEQP